MTLSHTTKHESHNGKAFPVSSFPLSRRLVAGTMTAACLLLVASARAEQPALAAVAPPAPPAPVVQLAPEDLSPPAVVNTPVAAVNLDHTEIAVNNATYSPAPYQYSGYAVAGREDVRFVDPSPCDCLDLETPNLFGESIGNGITVGFFNPVDFTGPWVGANRLQVAENNSPLPRNRAYYNFDFYDNAYQSTNQDIKQNTFGFEKTFLSDWMSLELRIPFAFQPSSSQSIGGPTGDNRDVEFGNVSLLWKSLLYRNSHFAASGGLGFNAPTGPGMDILSEDGPEWHYREKSWTIAPFLAAVARPTERWFTQGFLDVTVPIGENDVDYSRASVGAFPNMTASGTIQDQVLLHADLAVGYWFYYRPERTLLPGAAFILETNYVTSISDGDSTFTINDPFLSSAGSAGFSTIGSNYGRSDIWNLVLGTNIQMHERVGLALGWTIPLSALPNNERVFDWQFMLRVNVRYGAL